MKIYNELVLKLNELNNVDYYSESMSLLELFEEELISTYNTNIKEFLFSEIKNIYENHIQYDFLQEFDTVERLSVIFFIFEKNPSNIKGDEVKIIIDYILNNVNSEHKQKMIYQILIISLENEIESLKSEIIKLYETLQEKYKDGTLNLLYVSFLEM